MAFREHGLKEACSRRGLGTGGGLRHCEVAIFSALLFVSLCYSAEEVVGDHVCLFLMPPSLLW